MTDADVAIRTGHSRAPFSCSISLDLVIEAHLLDDLDRRAGDVHALAICELGRGAFGNGDLEACFGQPEGGAGTRRPAADYEYSTRGVGHDVVVFRELGVWWRTFVALASLPPYLNALSTSRRRVLRHLCSSCVRTDRAVCGQH